MTSADDRSFPARPIVGIGAIVLGPLGVLLIQRGKAPRIGSWSLPGGGQELGETVYEAARREVREETGLEIDIVGIVDVVDSITHDRHGQIEYHYTLVDVLAVPIDDRPPVAGSDVSDAIWADLNGLAPYALWSETERVISEAVRMLKSEPQRSRNEVETEL